MNEKQWLKQREECKKANRCRSSPTGYEACVWEGTVELQTAFAGLQEFKETKFLGDCTAEKCKGVKSDSSS